MLKSSVGVVVALLCSVLVGVAPTQAAPASNQDESFQIVLENVYRPEMRVAAGRIWVMGARSDTRDRTLWVFDEESGEPAESFNGGEPLELGGFFRNEAFDVDDSGRVLYLHEGVVAGNGVLGRDSLRRLSVDGSVDSTFVSDEIVVDGGYASLVSRGVTLMSDDSVVVSLGTATIRILANGDQDTSFGGDGVLRVAGGLTPAPDGASLLAVTSTFRDDYVAVDRFGLDGLEVSQFERIPMSAGNSRLFVRNDGSVFVQRGRNSRGEIVSFNSDGSFDPDGGLEYDRFEPVGAFGESGFASRFDDQVMLFSPDWRVDRSFGAGGVVEVDPDAYLDPVAVAETGTSQVLVQSSGSFPSRTEIVRFSRSERTPAPVSGRGRSERFPQSLDGRALAPSGVDITDDGSTIVFTEVGPFDERPTIRLATTAGVFAESSEVLFRSDQNDFSYEIISDIRIAGRGSRVLFSTANLEVPAQLYWLETNPDFAKPPQSVLPDWAVYEGGGFDVDASGRYAVFAASVRAGVAGAPAHVADDLEECKFVGGDFAPCDEDSDVYVIDFDTGAVEPLTSTSDAKYPGLSSTLPAISGNGDWVVFTTDVNFDGLGIESEPDPEPITFRSRAPDSIFVVHRTNSSIDPWRVNRSPDGEAAVDNDQTDPSGSRLAAGASPSISANGRFISYVSAADNLVDEGRS